jgi:hypothetical protein
MYSYEDRVRAVKLYIKLGVHPRQGSSCELTFDLSGPSQAGPLIGGVRQHFCLHRWLLCPGTFSNSV